MKPETRYLRLMFGLLIGLMGLAAAVNWLVDPFSVFDSPRIVGFNANKPGYVDHLRLTHVYRVQRVAPDCILLGTSRTGRGLRPDHPALAGHECYNQALPAISMYEMRRYLQHAAAIRPLKRVILALDFRVMNTAADRSGAFVEQRLAVDTDGRSQFNLFSAWLPDMTSSLASLPALQASFSTVRKQSWVRDTLSPRGYWAPLTDRYDHPAGFRSYTANTLRRYEEVRRSDEVFRRNADELRLLLGAAYATGADVRVLISPSHAWHWQALWISGLWPRFNEMKRLLVRANAEEAARVGREPFPLWDFTGSDGPALEPLPVEPASSMRWFWEPVHYKGALGDILLDRIHGVAMSDPALAGFGVRLDQVDLEAHLSRLQNLQQRFAVAKPLEVSEIERLAAQVHSKRDVKVSMGP